MNFDNLHQILRSLYEQMMPLCGDMAGVAKGIAGLGALFYVAYRVWQSLARAEPIDVFPMLRPFAIGLCIMFFPTVVLGTINSIMSPVVQGTAKMLEAETLDMNQYREQKDKLEYEAMMRNPETAYLVSNEEFDKQLEELGAIAFGYTKLLEESNDVLTELKNVVNITTLSMTDKERMDVVERCYSKMKRYRNLVSYYTNKNISVSYLRAKKKNDLDRIMGLYGNMNERYW